MTDGWSVEWSEAFPSISMVLGTQSGLFVGAGLDVIRLGQGGARTWALSMPGRPYAGSIQDQKLGVLAGIGFHVLEVDDGRPLTEGRSTPSGFSDILARPGGGWGLSDRGTCLHLFNDRGLGLRRIDVGPIQRLIGWLDRDHLVWRDPDGVLHCGRFGIRDHVRRIDDRRWTWASRLQEGRMLVLDSTGRLSEGRPHPHGWDELTTFDDDAHAPMRAHLGVDGWWCLDLGGKLGREDGTHALGHGGDFLTGWGHERLVTGERTGILRIWRSPELADLASAELRTTVEEAQAAMDWNERRQRFEEALKAEDEHRWEDALDLHRSLGRDEDVRRVLQAREVDR